MTTQGRKDPRVLDYLDLHTYLRDYYEYRKGGNSQFSYETWAQELDFGSRSFLRMMVLGKKRVTESLIQCIAARCFLSEDEREYFLYLAKYSQARTSPERQAFGQKLMQILRRELHPVEIAPNKDFVSSPLVPRLLALFNYEDVVTSAKNLAEILGQSLEETQKALKVLESLGLVQEVTPDRWSSPVKTFKVPDDKKSRDLRVFHELSLQEAIKAFDQPAETRRYKSLLLPMSQEDFENFNKLLDEFAKEQMARHNPKVYAGKRLFQVNFNIYPVTANARAERDL